MTTDDDRGLVALAVALHKAFVPDDTPGHELDDLPEAAAILGERGVFLPEGLPEVPLDGLLEDFDGAP